MRSEDATADVERQERLAQDSPSKSDKAAVKEEKKNPADTPFKRFLAGPYFDIIPAQYERTAHAVNRVAKPAGAEADAKDAEEIVGEDYMGRLRKIVMSKLDVDGDYGLNAEELVPLPFDVPKWHAYLIEIMSGVYTVAQATIVMFIAIYVENQERSWKSGGNYTKSWQPLVKALIIVYPLVTLIILVSFTVEYSLRKFMYFRLLSMRILVDWANLKPHMTVFFYYFLATWVLMNAWAIYGVAKYYDKDGNDGVDPVSFGTFIVVNLQTIQLLLYYFRVLSTESRLVSLNQIFERAPVEAQHLLEFTYVIEEEDLIDECYGFALYSQRTLGRRMLNIMTCCLAARDWNKAARDIRFDINRLKVRAPNYKQVEDNVKELLEEMGMTKPNDETVKPDDPMRNPDQVELEVDTDKERVRSNAAFVAEVGDDGRPRPRVFPREDLSLCGCRPLRWAYKNAYASLHSLHTAVLISFDTWPFRPDVPYFRFLTLVQLIGIVAVGAIVVLGWVYSASATNCTKASKTCSTCYTMHERYFASNEPPCLPFETAIANIVASANGTWYNNGRLEERYCNWACFGQFTPNQTCPALS